MICLCGFKSWASVKQEHFKIFSNFVPLSFKIPAISWTSNIKLKYTVYQVMDKVSEY